MISVTVVILSIAIFTALVINMAVKPSYSARLTAVLMMISACGGSVIYINNCNANGFKVEGSGLGHRNVSGQE